MNTYNSPESALEDLQKRGFVYDLSLQGNCLECEEAFTTLQPGEFKVAEVYRFEDEKFPHDPTIVYAIDSLMGIRGILLNAEAGSLLMSEHVCEPFDFQHN